MATSSWSASSSSSEVSTSRDCEHKETTALPSLTTVSARTNDASSMPARCQLGARKLSSEAERLPVITGWRRPSDAADNEKEDLKEVRKLDAKCFQQNQRYNLERSVTLKALPSLEELNALNELMSDSDSSESEEDLSDEEDKDGDSDSDGNEGQDDQTDDVTDGEQDSSCPSLSSEVLRSSSCSQPRPIRTHRSSSEPSFTPSPPTSPQLQNFRRGASSEARSSSTTDDHYHLKYSGGENVVVQTDNRLEEEGHIRHIELPPVTRRVLPSTLSRQDLFAMQQARTACQSKSRADSHRGGSDAWTSVTQRDGQRSSTYEGRNNERRGPLPPHADDPLPKRLLGTPPVAVRESLMQRDTYMETTFMSEACSYAGDALREGDVVNGFVVAVPKVGKLEDHIEYKNRRDQEGDYKHRRHVTSTGQMQTPPREVVAHNVPGQNPGPSAENMLSHGGASYSSSRRAQPPLPALRRVPWRWHREIRRPVPFAPKLLPLEEPSLE